MNWMAFHAWLAFGVVWFGLKGLDAFMGHPNETFNAALAVTAAAVSLARDLRDAR